MMSGMLIAREEPLERREERVLEVRFQEQRPHLERRPQMGEEVRRVGERRVVRQDEVRAGLREYVLLADDRDSIAPQKTKRINAQVTHRIGHSMESSRPNRRAFRICDRSV